MVKKRSDRWAVLIGINGYHESLGPLKYSVNDCRRLAEVLTTGDDAFPADHVLVLADDEAAERKPTYANIHSWLASWLAQPDEDDTILVFFAGHGRYEDGKCYLVPGDATLQTIHVTGIPVPYIQELLNRCKARQKVLILDACHSGAGRDVSTMAAPMMETLSAGKGIYTLTSCDVDELSHEWDEKAQGVFSYYLAEALSGSCPPDAHGRITAEAVYDWVYTHVQRWSWDRRCKQTPRRLVNSSGPLVLRETSAACDPPKADATCAQLSSPCVRVDRDEVPEQGEEPALPTKGLRDAIMDDDAQEVRANLFWRGLDCEMAAALHLACQQGDYQVCRVILDHGADANKLDVASSVLGVSSSVFDRWAPIHYAAHNGHLGVVRLLLSHGAKIDMETVPGAVRAHKVFGAHRWDGTPVTADTALTLAIKNGHAEVVAELLSQGADAVRRIPSDDILHPGPKSLLEFTVDRGDVETARVIRASMGGRE